MTLILERFQWRNSIGRKRGGCRFEGNGALGRTTDASQREAGRID